MRGKDNQTASAANSTGITPAYAGKRKFKPKKTTDDWDHPRVCGEKYQDKNGNKRTAGITPAYAGKSHCHPGQCGRNGDHPRVCGEKNIDFTSFGMVIGSPPRMRGKAVSTPQEKNIIRITPAYAGKSCSSSSSSFFVWDHPRVCGEKQIFSSVGSFAPGSPPRMRGKELPRHFVELCIGITPAYAGKRRSSATRPTGAPDHPRVCGEKTKKIP